MLTTESVQQCLESAKLKSPKTLYNCYIAPKILRKHKPSFKSDQSNLDNLFHIDSQAKQELMQLIANTFEHLVKENRTANLKSPEYSKKNKKCHRLKPKGNRNANNLLNIFKISTKPGKISKLNASPTLKNIENDEFAQLPGTWIECVLCKKWRFMHDVHDPSEVISDWYCGLQKKWTSKELGIDNRDIACQEIEEDTTCIDNSPFIFNKFTAGSVVWAKMTGFPWWPAMVDKDFTGRYAQYDRKTHVEKRYNVVFLDPDQMTTRWLPASNLRKFELDKIGSTPLVCAKKYENKIKAAVNVAKEALSLSIKDRIEMYSYPLQVSDQRPNAKRQKHTKKVEKDVMTSWLMKKQLSIIEPTTDLDLPIINPSKADVYDQSSPVCFERLNIINSPEASKMIIHQQLEGLTSISNEHVEINTCFSQACSFMCSQISSCIQQMQNFTLADRNIQCGTVIVCTKLPFIRSRNSMALSVNAKMYGGASTKEKKKCFRNYSFTRIILQLC